MKRKSLIILLLIAAFITVGCGKKSEKKEEIKEEEIKEVTYFNDIKTTDKLGFIISYYDDINIFFGIDDEDIAATFKAEEGYLENDKIYIKLVDEDELSFEYGEIDYHIVFETGYVNFSEKDKNLLKSFNGYEVVYQDGGFIISEYYGKYYVYYITYIGEHYESDYAYALKFDYYHSKEEALEKLKIFKKTFNVCSYKNDINECQDINGNKIDYKKYRYIKDMIIDYLAANNLYIASYEEIILFRYGLTKIIDKSTLAENDDVKFDVEVHNYRYNFGDNEPVGRLNGCDIYYENGASSIYIKNQNRFYLITIDLPYGVRYDAENIKKTLKDTFKK